MTLQSLMVRVMNTIRERALVSPPALIGCKAAVDPTSTPVRIGASSGVTGIKLISRLTHATVEKAATTWAAIVETFNFALFIKILLSEGPSIETGSDIKP